MPGALDQVSRVREAAAFLKSRAERFPEIAIVLGTGLGELARHIDVTEVVDYIDLPNFPTSTVESHAGRFVFGELEGRPVVAMQGRFHLYEGYSAEDITLPIRALALNGVATLVISNAAGGMNPLHRRGDLMLIVDHVNLQGVNPLVGPNVDAWGPRFPDMSEPYDPALRALAERSALDRGVKLHQGVYVSVTGPNLETRSEYRFLRGLGGDAVGMSTVPEVIVARHMGMRVVAISVITDECFPDALEAVVLEDIFAAAAAAEPNLTAIMRDVVRNC
jgi:purine-nucleoside phosphorylase